MQSGLWQDLFLYVINSIWFLDITNAIWCSISLHLWSILNSCKNDTALITVANSTEAYSPRTICYLHLCSIILPLIQYRLPKSPSGNSNTPRLRLGVFELPLGDLAQISLGQLKYPSALPRGIWVALGWFGPNHPRAAQLYWYSLKGKKYITKERSISLRREVYHWGERYITEQRGISFSWIWYTTIFSDILLSSVIYFFYFKKICLCNNRFVTLS